MLGALPDLTLGDCLRLALQGDSVEQIVAMGASRVDAMAALELAGKGVTVEEVEKKSAKSYYGEGSIKDAAWKAAKDLMGSQIFLTMEDTGEILRYEEGIYRPDGKAYIQKKVQEKALEKSDVSTHLINEALGHVGRSTLAPRSMFEEAKPKLVTADCVVDLETLQREEFSPDYHALGKMPVTYAPEAGYKASSFWTFINEILPSEDVGGVQEELGAILRMKYLTKKISIWVGETDTGKTTLASVFLSLLGPENVSSVPIQQLGARDRFAIADLYGKMANIRDDLTKDVVYSIGNLKELTGGFQVRGEKKFTQGFNFVNHAFMIFTCNVLPKVEEDDNAFWNRVMLRQFSRTFGGKPAPDRELLARTDGARRAAAWSSTGASKASPG